MKLVSACLAGCPCRYDGKPCTNDTVMALVTSGQAIPVCPEQLAGMPAPRSPSEIVTAPDGSKRVMTKDGQDVTDLHNKGAALTLAIAQATGANEAVLKSRSPSCGCGRIYDGTFSGQMIDVDGVTTALLKQNGIKVCTEIDL